MTAHFDSASVGRVPQGASTRINFGCAHCRGPTGIRRDEPSVACHVPAGGRGRRDRPRAPEHRLCGAAILLHLEARCDSAERLWATRPPLLLEPRPLNDEANHMRGRSGVAIDGASADFNRTFRGRVDGNFTGTTDEIIQWAACKWGFDEDVTRARAVQESYWEQSKLGDRSDNAGTCALIGKSAPCWQSYGILQVKATVHKGTYPLAEQSTAFNVDYALGWLRACYEGAFSHWLGDDYAPGDEWGCIGAWYSGKWYDGGAAGYIGKVKAHLAARVWEEPHF